MNIKNAKYVKNQDGNISIIHCDIDGIHHAVPLNPDNRHYKEIMKQVEEKTLTIADAD